jgi:hypothetical protein
MGGEGFLLRSLPVGSEGNLRSYSSMCGLLNQVMESLTT